MKLTRIAAAIGVFFTLAAAAAPVVAFAKDGADNPAGDVRHGGDDGPRHR